MCPCFAGLWAVAFGTIRTAFPLNELVGGPRNGHAHLLDSNIAWGQDILYLKTWYDEHPEARPLHLAHYGFVDPHMVGIEFTLPPVAPTSRAPRTGIPVEKMGPLPGWYAIDVNQLHGTRLGAADGHNGWKSLPKEGCDLTYFQRFQPVGMAGYSIYIYHIALDEANRVRSELGLPRCQRPMAGSPSRKEISQNGSHV